MLAHPAVRFVGKVGNWSTGVHGWCAETCNITEERIRTRVQQIAALCKRIKVFSFHISIWTNTHDKHANAHVLHTRLKIPHGTFGWGKLLERNGSLRGGDR